LFILSAITPPTSEKTRVGINPVAFIAVTINAESVISNTNQPLDIVDIKKEIIDARDAHQKKRNRTEVNALSGPFEEDTESLFNNLNTPFHRHKIHLLKIKHNRSVQFLFLVFSIWITV